MAIKYVWLELNTSWKEGEMALASLDVADINPNWKLIKYECLSDDKFEFCKMMRLR